MAAIDNWARIDVNIINAHLRELVKVGVEEHVLLSRLKSRGRLMMRPKKYIGKNLDWLVRHKRHDPTPTFDMEPNTFVRVSRNKKATLPWRAYHDGELYSWYEELVSSNPETAIVDIVSEMTEAMASDFNDYFHLELYNDGEAAATNTRLHGLESCFGTESVGENYVFGSCSGTYANLTLDLGTYGGDWDAPTDRDFPIGTGDLEHHFWHPIVVDCQDLLLTADIKEYWHTWRECFRLGATYQQMLHGKPPDLWLTNAENYRQSLDSLEDKERYLINQSNDVTKLGFGNITWEGIPLVAEYGCPADVVYGLRLDKMALVSLQDQLFAMKDQRDIDYDAQKVAMRFAGNMMFDSPAFLTKISALT